MLRSGRQLDRLKKLWNGSCAVILFLDLEQVRTTLTRIAQNPFQYQVITGAREHRRAPLRQFPFGIWYRVEPR